jgi:putative DNA primase/helicase
MDTLSDPYLPEALKCFRDKKIWVGMEVGSDGKKRPINPFTGEFASCNDSNTWGTFIEAKNTLQGDISSRYAPQYVAIALSKDLGLVVIDLDGVRNPITREIEPWASEIVEKIDSYAEISQSGEGIHIYLLGAKTTTACRGQKIEVYDSGRFMMVTNNSLGEVSPLREASKELEEVCLKYLEKNRPHRMPIDHITTSSPMEDEEIIEKASNAKNGAKFKSLYFDGEIGAYGGDESRADQGLMSILVFWTQDKEQLERIFSKSTLGQRDKWNKRQDYRSRTIQAALDACLKVYESSQEKENIPLEEIIQAYHDNEEGDARLFIRLHGENYRFDPVEKAFYRWNGTYWGVDRKKNRFEDIRDVAQYYEKMDVEDKTLKQKLQARAYALKGNKRLKDVLEVSTQGEGGLTFIGEWDNIPYILPCVNGMIDLQTGKLTPSSGVYRLEMFVPHNTILMPNALSLSNSCVIL